MLKLSVLLFTFALLAVPLQPIVHAGEQHSIMVLTHDGAEYEGYILREASRGFLFRTHQETLVIPFSDIAAIVELGPTSERPE